MKKNEHIANYLYDQSIVSIKYFTLISRNKKILQLNKNQNEIIDSNQIIELKKSLSLILKAFYLQENKEKNQLEILKIIQKQTLNYQKIVDGVQHRFNKKQLNHINSILSIFNVEMALFSYQNRDLINFIFDKSNVKKNNNLLSKSDLLVISLQNTYKKNYLISYNAA